MKKERNEVIKTDLEIKQEAKRKAKIVGIGMNIIFTIIFAIYIIIEITKKEWIPAIVVFLLGTMLVLLVLLVAKYFLPLSYEYIARAERSINYVNSRLSTEEFIEVVPKQNKREDCEQELLKNVKVYAIINKEKNVVEIKYGNQEKTHIVFMEYFYDNYFVPRQN